MIELRNNVCMKHKLDDLVLVAHNREALQDMMSTFKRFLEGRKLELCTENTKIMMCGGNGRKRKEK